ncbi:hypothetical protein ACVW1C_007103 [Bradyrhizobium sp. USDA 4011]
MDADPASIEAHHREVGRQRRDEVRGADLRPAALEEERGVLAAELDIGRAGRRRVERSCGDAAVGIEEHQRVVVHLAVVGGVMAATRIEYLTSSVEALVQVAVAAAEHENVSIGAEVTSTGLNEKRPAACSAATMPGSVVKSLRDSEKPWAPMPPNAPIQSERPPARSTLLLPAAPCASSA